MNNSEALKIYNRKTSSKEELREALAFLLGIHYKKPVKTISVFEQCKVFFLQKYYDRTNIDYYWQAKDAKALSNILNQLVSLNVSEDNLYLSFQHLIIKLPEWYQKNAYNTSIINSKFNDIVRIIRQQNNGNSNITNSYKQRIISDLFS